MDRETGPQEPKRLRDEPGAAADLLRQGEAAFRRGLDESRAFRGGTRVQRRRALVGWAAAAAVCATVLVSLGTNAPRNVVATFSVTAEPPSTAPARVPTAAPPTLGVSAAPVTAPRALPAPTASSEAFSSSTSEEECKRQLAANTPERAVECFRARSRENGLDGEVALYEAARVSVESLNDPSRALPWLEEHRQRFPNGVMRGEIDWLRVRSLERAGRFQEALTASEALLATPAGRTLSGELHLLRARVLADSLGNCADAVSELVALIGEPSSRGDEAELRRAACLEKLGRKADAVAAYTQYLTRAEPKRAAHARERLAALQP